MSKSTVSKELKVGEFVLHFQPATFNDVDNTIHNTYAEAQTKMKKLAAKQLHWSAQILEVKSMHGCKCHE